MGDLTLTQQIQALRLTFLKINDWVKERLSSSLTTPIYPYKQEETGWVKMGMFKH
jgi:hypothetical protein